MMKFISRCRAAVAALLLTSSVAQASDFVVGVGASYRDGEWAMAKAAQLGFDGSRDDLPWKLVEKEPGVFSMPDWAEKTLALAKEKGMTHMVILAYGNPLYNIVKPDTPKERALFANYCKYVVSRLKGQVQLFEVWNEWDSRTGGGQPGTPEDYIELLKVVYPVIKAANPNAIVLSGGISDHSLDNGWYTRFLKAGGWKYVDGISVHAYTFQRSLRNGPESSYGLVEDAIKEADKIAPTKSLPFYVTEIGWPTFDGPKGVSETQMSANYAMFMMLSAANPRIKGVWWYGMKNQGTDPKNKNQQFGLVRKNGEEKLGLAAVRYTNRSLQARRPKTVCNASGGAAFDIADPDKLNSVLRAAWGTVSWLPNCKPNEGAEIFTKAGEGRRIESGIQIGRPQQ